MRTKFFTLGVIIAAGMLWLGYAWMQGGVSLPGAGTVTPSQPVTVYKWRDGNGQWHFSNTPPTDQPYETQTVEAKNILPALEKPHPTAGDTSGIHPLTPITDPGRVIQLVDDARGIEQRLQQRSEQMERQAK